MSSHIFSISYQTATFWPESTQHWTPQWSSPRESLSLKLSPAPSSRTPFSKTFHSQSREHTRTQQKSQYRSTWSVWESVSEFLPFPSLSWSHSCGLSSYPQHPPNSVWRKKANPELWHNSQLSTRYRYDCSASRTARKKQPASPPCQKPVKDTFL